jgi:hypothetical protein
MEENLKISDDNFAHMMADEGFDTKIWNEEILDNINKSIEKYQKEP